MFDKNEINFLQKLGKWALAIYVGLFVIITGLSVGFVYIVLLMIKILWP